MLQRYQRDEPFFVKNRRHLVWEVPDTPRPVRKELRFNDHSKVKIETCYFLPGCCCACCRRFRADQSDAFSSLVITVAFFHTSPVINSHHIPTPLGSSPRSPCLLSTICNDPLPVGRTPLSLPCSLPTSVLLLFNLVIFPRSF